MKIVTNGLARVNRRIRRVGGLSYPTVPGVGSLAPGQSVTLNVLFKNFSNAVITFIPVVYVGGFN